MADLSFSVIYNKSQGIFAACMFASSYSSPDTWSSISKAGQSPLQHRKLHYSLSFWSGFAACIKFSAAMATHLFAVALATWIAWIQFKMQLWLHINTYFKCSRKSLSLQVDHIKMLWVKKSYNKMQAKNTYCFLRLQRLKEIFLSQSVIACWTTFLKVTKRFCFYIEIKLPL